MVTEGEADLPGIVTSNLIDHLQSQSQRGWMAKRDLCIDFVLEVLSSLEFHFSVPASFVLSQHPVSTEQGFRRELTYMSHTHLSCVALYLKHKSLKHKLWAGDPHPIM